MLNFSDFSKLTTPQLAQRERIRTNYVNLVSITCPYSSHQVSSKSLHSKGFPRLLFLPQPSMSPEPIQIENGASET